MPQKITLKSPYAPKQDIPTFTSQPFANLYINVQHTVIPVHWIKLLPSQYVARNINKKIKIIIIHEHIDIQFTLAVVAYLYGYDIHVGSMQQLSKLLNVLEVLQIPKIKDKISQILCSKIKVFDTFELLQITHKFSLTDVQQMCIQYLAVQQFEQIKLYQYSICQCNFQLFQKILRKHHSLKIKKVIKGIPYDLIKQIIQLYCQRNHITNQIQQKLYQKYLQPFIFNNQTSSIINNQLQVKSTGYSLHDNGSQKQEKDDLSATGLSSGELPSFRKPSFNKRKFSMEIGKTLEEMGLEVLSRAKYISSISIESPQNIQQQNAQNEVSVQNLPIDSCNIYNADKSEFPDKFQIQVSQQTQEFCSSKLLNHYKQQLNTHNIKINEVKRRNAQSFIFQQVIQEELSIEDEIETKNKKNKFCKKVNFIQSSH